MKRQFLILIAIAALATALPTNASGQTVRACVKFDFQIGNRIYPAGEYQIESISYQRDNLLQIRSVDDTNKQQIIPANYSSAGKRQTPKLVFQKYGESYFLTQVFFDSEPGGYSICPSRCQRESEKLLASRIPRNN